MAGFAAAAATAFVLVMAELQDQDPGFGGAVQMVYLAPIAGITGMLALAVAGLATGFALADLAHGRRGSWAALLIGAGSVGTLPATWVAYLVGLPAACATVVTSMLLACMVGWLVRRRARKSDERKEAAAPA